MLRLHLESGRFRSGTAAGRWRFVSLDWPFLSSPSRRAMASNTGSDLNAEIIRVQL